jgi:hypothetical protein
MSDKKEITRLTAEQATQLFLAPIRSKEHLHAWIETYWGVDLAGSVVSRYSNCNPLDAMWNIYKAAIVDKVGLDLILVSPRGGYKTLCTSIIESLMLFHDQRAVFHCGVTETQAKRCFDYWSKFISDNKPITKPMIIKSTMERTTINVNGERVTYEVAPITLQALNGPHTPFFSSDEIDTLAPGSIQYKAFSQASGIPVKHPITNAPPIKLAISTRKGAYGIMQKMIDGAPESGKTVWIWNIIDLMEKCQTSRHGTEVLQVYVKQESMTTLIQREWEALEDDKKAEFLPYEATDGCAKCPLFSVCLGDLKKQTSTAKTLQSIDDVITRVKGAGDVDWCLAELFCVKPSIGNVVFREFNVGKHVVSHAEMYRLITNMVFDTTDRDCTLEDVISAVHQRHLPVFGGIDFGFTAPSTLTLLTVTEDNVVLVLTSFGIKGVNDPTFLHMVKSKFHKKFKVQLYHPDTASASAVDLMKQMGLPVAKKIDKGENLGVQLIKKFLLEPGTGKVKFFVLGDECRMLIEEFQLYHYETDGAGNPIDGRFAKEDDHCFIPGTLVNTIEGTKPIESINVNDLVATHDGTYQKVTGLVTRKYDGDVLTIFPVGGTPITCSPEHPFYVQVYKRSYYVEDGRELRGQFRAFGEPQWIEARNLKPRNKKDSIRFLLLSHKKQNIEYPLRNVESCGNFFGRHIKKIEHSEYSGNLYNLHVENNESYYANGIIVHNCMDGLRYIITNVLGKAQMTMAKDLDVSSTDNPYLAPDRQSFTRAPTMLEMAEYLNIPVKNDDVHLRIGGTEDEDEQDGFYWEM